MITAGIDAGNNTSKVLIIKNGQVVSRARRSSGFDQKRAAREAFTEALRLAGLSEADVAYTIATGAGKHEVSFAQGRITEVGAAARGVISLFPRARTVIDVGAEEARALKMDETGKVLDFAVNDKCAAGAGSFVESMSRTLEVKLEEMGPLSLKAERAVPMNAQCAVFAESEVVSLIHARIPKAEIARSIHEAMAGRISSLVRRVGIEKETAIIGGLAYNQGFVQALEEELGLKMLIPEHPEYVSALGAALAASGKVGLK